MVQFGNRKRYGHNISKDSVDSNKCWSKISYPIVPHCAHYSRSNFTIFHFPIQKLSHPTISKASISLKQAKIGHMHCNIPLRIKRYISLNLTSCYIRAAQTGFRAYCATVSSIVFYQSCDCGTKWDQTHFIESKVLIAPPMRIHNITTLTRKYFSPGMLKTPSPMGNFCCSQRTLHNTLLELSKVGTNA